MEEKPTDRQLVAEFCGGLPELIDTAGELGIASQLQAARNALAVGFDAPADVVRQFRVAVGIDGLRGVRIDGQDPTAPPAGDYVCPRKICARRAEREPGGPVPRCQIFGAPMRFQP